VEERRTEADLLAEYVRLLNRDGVDSVAAAKLVEEWWWVGNFSNNASMSLLLKKAFNEMK
jgi:hypothetical protein